MTALSIDYRTPKAFWTTVAFIALVIGVGAVIGINSTPDAWYEGLAKPPFNPPNWVFGPVWFVLYLCIAVAGARTFLRHAVSPAMLLWALQMVLNWVWSPTWFTLHLLWPAFAIVAAMLATIIGFVVATWWSDRASTWLFVPYALWVAFAATLNLSIALLN